MRHLTLKTKKVNKKVNKKASFNKAMKKAVKSLSKAIKIGGSLNPTEQIGDNNKKTFNLY